MNRFKKIVSEIDRAENVRKVGTVNAVAMFAQARSELRSRSKITFLIPDCDPRDPSRSYVLERKILPNDPGFPSIEHIVLRTDDLLARVIAIDDGKTLDIKDEKILFQVANHLMEET